MTTDPFELNLEQRLRTWPGEPPAHLRGRVLRAVDAELHGKIPDAEADRITWRFAAAIAACMLLGSALAGIGASTFSIEVASSAPDRQLRATEAALTKLEPGLSPTEAGRMARVLSSVNDLPRVPRPVMGNPLTLVSDDASSRADVVPSTTGTVR